jgi:hypothetical protein
MNYDHLFKPKSKSITSKKKNFSISSEELAPYIEDFLKSGGVIKKVETEDFYYDVNPVKSDNFTSSRGAINGSIDDL